MGEGADFHLMLSSPAVGVTVGFNAASYTFLENDTSASVVIDSESGEVAQDLGFFSPPIQSSFILVYSHDGSAQGNAMYIKESIVYPIGTKNV